jgi:hypothetical protein
LRKERHEGSEANETLLPLNLPPVEIDGVAHRLEGVEGDPDRKKNPRCRNGERDSQPYKQKIKIVGDKRAVLKEAEQEQVVDDAERQPELAPAALLHKRDGCVVDQRRPHDEQKIERIPPGIENVRGNQQPWLPEPCFFA